MKSFFTRIQMELPVPCYIQICRRSEHQEVKIKIGNYKAVTDLMVDSTGLKGYGEEEWKVRMYSWGRYRT